MKLRFLRRLEGSDEGTSKGYQGEMRQLKRSRCREDLRRPRGKLPGSKQREPPVACWERTHS